MITKKEFLRRDFKRDFFFFWVNFKKNIDRNWHKLQNEIFKASDAFILPYKYSLSFFCKNEFMGKFFPQTPKKFWKEQIKLWEKEQLKNKFG
jgi:hypothetical protein